jgi:hypothetical protein
LFVSACLYICQWVCLRMRAFVRLCVCVNHCVSIGVFARVRVQRACVCVGACRTIVCVHLGAVSALCWHAGTGGINSSAGGAGGRVCVVAVRCHRPGSRAFGRRWNLDEPHNQRAVGWPISAHDRDRRRRRHLRHRRRRRHRLRQRRVVEHRRRYAGRTQSGAVVGGTLLVLLGVLRGTTSLHRGSSGGPQVYLGGAKAVLRRY